MKYLMIAICIIFLGLVGCKQQEKIEIEDIDQKTGVVSPSPVMSPSISGNLDRKENIIGSGYAFSLDSHTLLYDNFFSISLPKNLQFWTNEYQSYENLRLDFYTENSSKNRLQGYFKLYVSPISEWREKLSNKEKCIFGNYDENIVSKTTSYKTIDDREIYITYITFSAFDNIRKQGDLCFIEGNIIYTISVGGYTDSYITNILDSLIFLD